MKKVRRIATGSMNRDLKRVIPDHEFGPWEALAYGIMEQAITDFKTLYRAGIILKGGIVTDWPTYPGTETHRQYCGMRKRNEADSIIHWLRTGGLDEMATAVGLNLDGQRVCKELGL